jgi:hypothetical protein
MGGVPAGFILVKRWVDEHIRGRVPFAEPMLGHCRNATDLQMWRAGGDLAPEELPEHHVSAITLRDWKVIVEGADDGQSSIGHGP